MAFITCPHCKKEIPEPDWIYGIEGLLWYIRKRKDETENTKRFSGANRRWTAWEKVVEEILERKD